MTLEELEKAKQLVEQRRLTKVVLSKMTEIRGALTGKQPERVIVMNLGGYSFNVMEPLAIEVADLLLDRLEFALDANAAELRQLGVTVEK